MLLLVLLLLLVVVVVDERGVSERGPEDGGRWRKTEAEDYVTQE